MGKDSVSNESLISTYLKKFEDEALVTKTVRVVVTEKSKDTVRKTLGRKGVKEASGSGQEVLCCVSRYNLLLWKIPLKDDPFIDVNFMDIYALTSPQPARLSILMRGEKDEDAEITIQGEGVDHILNEIIQQAANNFPGMDSDQRFIIDAPPHDRQIRLENIRATEDGPCRNFARTYKATCRLLGQAPQESTLHDIENVYATHQSTDFFLLSVDTRNRTQARALLAALKYNTWFQTLSLRHMLFEKDTLQLIQSVLATNRTLTTVVLNDCGLMVDAAVDIIAGIGKNRKGKINSVDFSSNPLDDKALFSLAEQLRAHPSNLLHLYLNKLDISKSCGDIFKAIQANQKLYTLQTLEIEGARLDKVSSAEFVMMLKRTQNLVHVNLSNVGPKADLASILDSLKLVASLETLNISKNELTKKNKQKLIPSLDGFISSAPRLIDLNLGEMGLSGEEIGPLVGKARRVGELALRLRGNPLSVAGLTEIATTLRVNLGPRLLDLTDTLLADVPKKENKDRALNAIEELIKTSKNLRVFLWTCTNLKYSQRQDLLKVVTALMDNKSVEEIDISGHKDELCAIALAKVLHKNRTLHTVAWDSLSNTTYSLKAMVIALEHNNAVQRVYLPIKDIAELLNGDTRERTVTLAKKLIPHTYHDHAQPLHVHTSVHNPKATPVAKPQPLPDREGLYKEVVKERTTTNTDGSQTVEIETITYDEVNTAKVWELEQIISSLEQEREEWRSHGTGQETIIREHVIEQIVDPELEAEVAQVRQENQELHNRIEALEAENRRVLAQLDNLETEAAEQETRFESRLARVRQEVLLESQMSQLSVIAAGLEVQGGQGVDPGEAERRVQAEAEAEAARSEAARLQAQLTACLADCSTHRTTIVTLESKITELTSELTEAQLSASLAGLTRFGNNPHSQEIEELKAEIQRLQAQLALAREAQSIQPAQPQLELKLSDTKKSSSRHKSKTEAKTEVRTEVVKSEVVRVASKSEASDPVAKALATLKGGRLELIGLGLATLQLPQAHIVVLDLSYNNFTELPDLRHLNTLEVLRVASNKLTQLNVAALPKPGTLIELSINNNQLESLPEELCVYGLKRLDVSSNQLLVLPHDLGKLPLQELTLRGNKELSGFPLSLSRSPLSVLDASACSLTVFPGFLANMATLSSLNLSHNRLKALPDLSTLPALALLDVSNNQLTQTPHVRAGAVVRAEGNNIQAGNLQQDTLHSLSEELPASLDRIRAKVAACQEIPELKVINQALGPLKAAMEVMLGHLPPQQIPEAKLAYDKSSDRVTQVKTVLNEQLDFFANILVATAQELTLSTDQSHVKTIASDVESIRKAMTKI